MTRRPRGSTPRTRVRAVLLSVLALIGAMLPTLALGGTAAHAAVPSDFQQGSFVSPTLEGCRGSAGVSFPILGPFVCPATEYTSGNLGKGWNELDNVPHRLTTSLGNQSGATTAYDLILAADNSATSASDSFEGYDFISTPVVSSASHGSCTIAKRSDGEQVDITGGVHDGKYIVVRITQNKGTTCVFDYYMRLSITSAEYSGSSLQGYMFEAANFQTGKRTVPIPVKDVQPQDFSNATNVTQDEAHPWEVLKTPTPTSLEFGNSCLTGGANLSRTVSIEVKWRKLAATPAGVMSVIAQVWAINPAHRPITTTITNTIRSGTTTLTPLAGSVDVNPKSATLDVNPGSTLLFTHSILVPAGTTSINSYGVASYADPVPPHPAIPGTNTRTTNATSSPGTTTAGSAVVRDVESITGNGFSYKVTAVSGSGSAGGTFTVPDGADGDSDPDAYALDTATAQPVTWTSAARSPDIGVWEYATFAKTVLLDQARVSTGTLSDTATVTNGSDQLATDTKSVGLNATALVAVTIDKTIPNILDTGESVTFGFKVRKVSDRVVDGDGLITQHGTVVASPTITFGAGETQKSVTASGLDPDVYYVTEDPATGWAEQAPSADVDLSVGTGGVVAACGATVSFSNSFGPATARAVKTTNPSGSENGWEMCLTGPGTPLDGECVTTATLDHDGNPETPAVPGYAPFTTVLEDDGAYTITETAQNGWEQTAATGDCTFTVTYPADFDRLFTCSFTNRQMATVTVTKTLDGDVPAAGTYTFQLRTGASLSAVGTVVATDTNDAAGLIDFDPPRYFSPGSYQLCEVDVPLDNQPVWSAGTPFVPGGSEADNSIRCVNVELTAGQSFTITVDNRTPGDGRTIGYWKNWSGACTNGRQADSLGTVLGSGISIGTLLVDQTCAEAVPLLDKRDISSGKKLAGHPAYNLAAQLLAAELNKKKGVITCAAVNATITAAQALLTAVGFDGTEVDDKTVMTKAQQAAANTYASRLDAYNNNTTSVACA